MKNRIAFSSCFIFVILSIVATTYAIEGFQAVPSSSEIMINGKRVEDELSSFIITDHIYLPIRRMANILGFDVQWDGIENRVRIVNPAFRSADRMNSENRYPVQVDEKWCYMNEDGKVILKTNVGGISEFSEGLAIVRDENNYLSGYMNEKGELVIPCKYVVAEPFQEGYAVVRDNSDGFSYFIDEQGRQAWDKKYPAALSFSEGLAGVIVEGAPNLPTGG